MLNEKLLWNQLEDFPLDDPNSPLNFTARLARDNKWSLHYARRVVTAYKKFLFLCMVSPTPVTPSDAVDQAWHLHMTYTESYWNDLCGKILGKPLHHNPTKGGLAEDDKFFDQYEETLELYREKFEEEPAADIWPPSNKRFSDTDFVRVNKTEFLLVPIPKRRNTFYALVVSIAGVIVSLIAANWAFMAVAGPAALIIATASDNFGSGSNASSGGCGSGCGTDGHHGCGGSHGCGSGCSSGCSSGCGGGCGGGGD